ncbi:hypothetical protein [Blautia obeum]|uniref:hypothetical protein n=1 Tax=Blautia obeum TaxID=40520 RepID=UPI001FB8D656|nr:hypothetical protein [Blautia obeum]
MLMSTLVILRFTGIFTAYTGITVLLPEIMFRRILKGRRLSEQFLMSYTFGNFYIINIVFALQLLHISNFFTLTAVTVLMSILIGVKVNRVPLRRKLAEGKKIFCRLSDGSLGIRSAVGKLVRWIADVCRCLAEIFYKYIVKKPIQNMFILLILGAMFWIYGRQIILTYGYRASDIPVHLSWINQMSRGKIFSKGVYPFGFHCMIYYLHTVFRIDTYVILCEFFFAQVIYLHAVLLAMLKLLCKTKYLPYIGVFTYIVGNFWAGQTYSRFYSTLPQEYGMIFVIPSVYFLIRFFQIHKENLKDRETRRILQCFAMAFSLTLAIHFYGTMIAGLCCIGIAMGFCFRFVKKEYFCRIMVTGILSVALAVLPMAIAFAGGTPLQGSLGWGMSVINGTQNNTSDTANTSADNKVKVTGEDGKTVEIDVSKLPSAKKDETTVVVEQKKPSLGDRIRTVTDKIKVISDKIKDMPNRLSKVVRTMSIRIRNIVIPVDWQKMGTAVMTAYAGLLLLGLVFCAFRKTEYGAALMSVGFCMLILTVLLCAGPFGLPTLMDAARCSIYYAYLLPVAGVVLADGILCFMTMPRIFRNGKNVLSLGISVVLLIVLLQKDLVKNPEFSSGYVTNGAITCLTNIIRENEDETWTIVSANDETQMGLDHGWHYETITFLRQLEKIDEDTKILIPTKNIYFFIEKIPLDYSVSYAGSGQSISKKGASQTLPNVGGIGMYQGEKRWIVMSRMYYWVQAFMKKYPNEMKVYYEDDQFICYRIPQNMYHQYNFAIDYGYNQVETEEQEAEQ